MSEKEIFQYVRSVITTDYLNKKINDKEYFGLSAKEIAEHFDIYRSTVSSLLNTAVKNGVFIKIDTRPVLFVPKDTFEEYIHTTLDKNVFTTDEIRDLFFKKKEDSLDPFSVLIGFDGSQALQVKQAQSAILYPPKGLHTLITGESGTGKTLFARTMYNYGKEIKGVSEKEFPFVEFNCADYYHNPQLLLSHLFGHIRGAFTGADQETEGLVEKANNGILFLDEIHRLPPEGQELLFYLMDTGHYRKMGEASTVREANILIIGATTEDPKDVLLKTFKRRIPLTINIPPLRERPIDEKLNIIKRLFLNEAIITQRTYIIDADIIKAITLYDFPENIGQLASEIKILCARSFLENTTKESDDINVPYKFLSDTIRSNFKKYRKNGYSFNDEYQNFNYDLVISPSSEASYLKDKIFSEESYIEIIDDINNYSKQGLSSNEVAARISASVSNYYDGILNKMYFKSISKEEVYKIIEPDIVDFSVELMKDIQKVLVVNISEQNIVVLAFHLKFLIERLRKTKLIDSSSQKIRTGDKIIDNMIDRIEEKFFVTIPKDEVNFFRVLIKNITNKVSLEEHSKACLYILAHGNTASSIANVCNRLLQTDFVKAFDMPLTQDVLQTYELFVEEIENISPKNGVMILADMGSLLTFGNRLTQDTGIPTHTIPNVSTAIALDFAHIMLNRNEHVDITYNDYLIKNRLEVNFANSIKQPAIISACSSGKGTSIAFKQAIEELLAENELDFIKVFALENSQLQGNKEEFKNIYDEYNIIAVVGNIHIDVDAPFFHITEIISREKKDHFVQFLKKTGVSNNQNTDNSKEPNISEATLFLSQHVMYVNPFAVQNVATEFINAIFDELDYESPNLETIRFSLIVHLGFMIERIIARKYIRFDDKDIYMRQNKNIFRAVQRCILIIEDAFEIEVSEDEMCYIIVTLYPETLKILQREVG